jgi:serine/threonine-protein kinase
VILGTAGYMAPEQVRGKPLDARADVWAFGIVLYEMLSGIAPFHGETVSDTLARVLEREPEWERLPNNLPSRLQRLLRRCLSKDPNQRLQAIGDARIEIEECLNDPAGLVERAPVTSPIWRRVVPWLMLPLALAAGWWLKPEPAPSIPPTLRFEWSLPEGDRLAHFYRQGVAISPDGLTIAAVSAPVESPYSFSEDVRILIRRFDQWRWQEVPGSKGMVQPEFSPDGEWLAVGGAENGKPVLRKLPLSGGEPTTLCECRVGYGVSWGSDGTIAFASITSTIQFISSSGGEPREITELDEERNEVSHRLPHFLPGGTAFLYTALRYREFMDAADIYVHSLDTGERKLLLEGATDARYVGSGHVVFVREGRLFAAPFDLDRLEIRGAETPVLDGINHAMYTGFSGRETGVAQFAVSPDGTLVYSGGSVFPDLPRELVWVDREGNETPPGVEPMNYRPQRVSRDGRTALLAKSYRPLDVWLLDLERGTTRRQTFEGNQYYAVWGPGPNQFTFGSDREGPDGLYVKTLDSGPGQVEKLPTGKQLSPKPGAWSSDGKVLLYVVQDAVTHQDIWTYTADDRTTRPWLVTQFWERHPDLSPDDRWVAYSSNQSGPREVYVRPLDGEAPVIQVSTDGGRSPAWSKDGRELFYRVGDKFLVVSVREDGGRLQIGAPVELFEGDYGGTTPIRSYDVSADGRFLLHRNPDEEALNAAIEKVFPDRVQVVQGWVAELRP